MLFSLLSAALIAGTMASPVPETDSTPVILAYAASDAPEGATPVMLAYDSAKAVQIQLCWLTMPVTYPRTPLLLCSHMTALLKTL
jgi:hypothetical protein